MRKKPEVIYYQDELKDEFAQDQIVPKKIDGSYRYTRDDLAGKCSHVFWYRIVAVPLAFLYMKIYFHHRIVHREKFRQIGRQACFVYGNHTHFLADALVPTMVSFPRAVSVIVHPNNVSMPVLGRITPALGALPLPDDGKAARHFMKAIEERVGRKSPIMIYPEAHIWPYYTKIRPFEDLSFRYPVQYHTPVLCVTNTYQKRRFSKRPRMVTYVDGPFYANEQLSKSEQKRQLRDEVYAVMQERARNNEVVRIRYEKRTQK